jgi:hypothetical protein
MAGVGHQDAFLRPRLNACCRFSQRTFATPPGNRRDAPIPAVQRQSGNLFGTRGGWTSPPPPSDSLQASVFNHSRASFFLEV